MGLTGGQYIPFEWCILILTLGVVLLRSFLRYRMHMTLSWADVFISTGWIFFFAQTCMDTALYRLGFFMDGYVIYTTTDFGPKFGHATYKNDIAVLKLLYVETCLYYTEMYCVKWAMLCFYNQLIPHGMKKMRIAMHITTGLTIVGWASSLLLKLFICALEAPMSTNWTPGPTYCDTNASIISNVYEWAFHVFTDLLIYILPMFLLHRLQLPFAQKVGIGATFGVGLGCIVFANLFQVANLRGEPYATVWMYSVWEQTWALVVVCCPALKSLVNGRGFFKTLKGQQSSMLSRTRKSMNPLSTKPKGTLLSNANEQERGELKGTEDRMHDKIANVTVSYELNTKTSSVKDDKSITAITTTAWSAY